MTITPAARSQRQSANAEPKALLQLSASRGKLALELAAPFPIGPLHVVKLVSSLDGLQFPVDLSGGVARFRHRRGSLDLMAVEAQFASLSQSLLPKAKSALNSRNLQLTLLPQDHGFTVGVHDEHFALAFDAAFAPDDETIRFVVFNARGMGLGCHPHAASLRLATTLCGRRARRKGSLITIQRALQHLAREVLLDAGARLPSCTGLRLGWHETQDGICVVASTSDCELSAPDHVVRALELARIAEYADNALAADHIDEARAAYLTALESAPRHPDLVLRIAELDAVAQHNPESTLATIVETMPAVDAGLSAVHMLAAIGDTEAAAVAARRAAEREIFAPLAARILALSASHYDELFTKLATLDEAVARCPSCSSIRWDRARARLQYGRFDDAAADLGQLEIAARGAQAKFEVCLDSGQLLLNFNQHREARSFFKRALRYVPRSAEASAGLARAFFAAGDKQRGVALLSRAVTLSESTQPPTNTFVLELAVALAERTHDLPSAIYHVRSIPFGSEQTVAARALEGRWRHLLEDTVGASHAFSQAREAAAQLPRQTVANLAGWLVEATRFELDVRHDALAAKRHIQLALEACPRDPEIENLFRHVARTLASNPSNTPGPLAQPPQEPAQEHQAGSKSTQIDDASPKTPTPKTPTPKTPTPKTPTPNQNIFDLSDSDVEGEARIEELTARVRAAPDDHGAVFELCELLERAGRLLDLMALVSARLEESSDPAIRDDLSAVYKRTLAALISECRSQSRDEEAEMYEMVLQTLA